MTRVTVNRAALTEHFARNPHAQKAIENVARAVMEAAKADSPRGRDPHLRGKPFRDLWNVRRYRTWWVVENLDPFAHLVEWGSRNNRTYAPLRRAIRSQRIKFIEKEKPHRRGSAG